MEQVYFAVGASCGDADVLHVESGCFGHDGYYVAFQYVGFVDG